MKQAYTKHVVSVQETKNKMVTVCNITWLLWSANCAMFSSLTWRKSISYFLFYPRLVDFITEIVMSQSLFSQQQSKSLLNSRCCLLLLKTVPIKARYGGQPRVSGRVVAWHSYVAKRAEFKSDYIQISLTRGHRWFNILSPGTVYIFFRYNGHEP